MANDLIISKLILQWIKFQINQRRHSKLMELNMRYYHQAAWQTIPPVVESSSEQSVQAKQAFVFFFFLNT
jgi:hypothetical protein